MGEVRVIVRLTNAADKSLARRGELREDQVRVYPADALVDTGAIRLVLRAHTAGGSHVVQQLGLGIRGQRVAEHARYPPQRVGRQDSVDFTEPVIVEIQGRDTSDEALVLGDEAIVGQTVIRKLDLLIDCVSRKLVPNPARPDQLLSEVK